MFLFPLRITARLHCVAVHTRCLSLSHIPTNSNSMKDWFVWRILSRTSFTNLFHIHQTKITIRIRTQIRHTRNRTVSSTLHCNTSIYIYIHIAGARAQIYMHYSVIPLHVNIENNLPKIRLFTIQHFSIPVDLQSQLTVDTTETVILLFWTAIH